MAIQRSALFVAFILTFVSFSIPISSHIMADIEPAKGNLQTDFTSRGVDNFTAGGYHIATGDWWEPNHPFSVSSLDSDGDGVSNSADDYPLDPALPPQGVIRGKSCVVVTANCVSEPTPAPFNPDPSPVSIQGSTSLSLDWGDVDGDGDLDLAVGNNGAQNALYLNRGNGLESTPSWTSSDSLVSIDVAWGDYDGDGDLDLAVANYEGPVQVFRNQQGTLTTTAVWSYLHGGSSVYSRGTSLDWGDVDRDGDLDLAVGILQDGIYLFRNSGLGLSPASYWNGGSSGNILDVKFADIDGDNDLDLLEAVSGGRNSVYQNSGNSFSSTTLWKSSDSLSTSSIAAGDIDSDGDMDIVLGNHGGSTQLFLSSTGTLPTSASWNSTETDDTMDVRLGDVDGDGDMDLIESNAGNSDHIRIFQGSDYGEGPVWSSDLGGDSSDSAWGDLDGDGDLDFATADGNDGPMISINGGQMIESSSSWNDGNSHYTYSMDLADIDDDGDLDLAYGNDGTSSKVYTYDSASGTYSQLWFTSSTPSADGIIWMDYDGDNLLDLIIGDYNSRNVGWKNTVAASGGGGGGGGGTQPFTGGGSAWQSQEFDSTMNLVSGDINGDGRADLVTINDGKNRVNLIASDSGTPSGYKLSNSASWSSSDSKTSACGALADFDDDGDIDLFVANYGQKDQIFFNTGTALQTSAGWQSTPTNYAQGCDVGDVDGDGDIDILVANENEPNQIYLNGGTGNFPASPSWSSAQSLDTVSIGLWDADNDGDLDIVEGNYASSNYIRLNDGTSFNSLAWQSPDILDTWVIEMGDVEGDGDIDLFVANEQQTNQLFLAGSDQDGDWVSEPDDELPNDPTQTGDADEDGYGDRLLGWLPDSCPGYWGDSWRDRLGCPDLDTDGQSDLYDPFMQKDTQWSDIDSDGMGDNWADSKESANRSARGLGQLVVDAYLPDPSPWDYDNDGFEDANLVDVGAIGPYDDCQFSFGTSYEDKYGCSDADRDGWSDDGDSHPGDATQYRDRDGDGYGDNLSGINPDYFPDEPTQNADSDRDSYGDNPDGVDGDKFPYDSTQWADYDGDGYGDHHKGNNPDACPMIAGNSTEDRLGCPDGDEDGWSDEGDLAPANPEVWSDNDRDGFDDQVTDDCVGEKGSSVHDRQGCRDQDKDGYSDPDGDAESHPDGQADAFADDNSQWHDSDGDGYGDNATGTEPDSCPSVYGVSTVRIVDNITEQWFGCEDQDGDGIEDDSDDCPMNAGVSTIDRDGCPDTDLDGISDAFDDCDLQPGTSTFGYIGCPDADGDGIPDSIDPLPANGNGTEFDWDGDGYPNPVDAESPSQNEDVFPNDPTQWNDTDGDGFGDNRNGNNPDLLPHDGDNDGVDDILDPFPEDPSEWRDSDGDGLGDNADSDDDNDGYSDQVELNELTDPTNANEHPIESWEFVLPGNIGLGAWDVVGILGGGPIGLWLAFGLLTRKKRAQRFEQELQDAETREALEEIAKRYEFSLMIRLIGPHQGIRLERLRAELDDELEMIPILMERPDIQTGIDQTEQVALQMEKDLPDLDFPAPEMTGKMDDDGYEWLEFSGKDWFREGEDDNWTLWEN